MALLFAVAPRTDINGQSKLYAKMKKSEILFDVLNKVSEATEIEASVILSKSRKEEHVEARIITIYCCIRRGLKPVQVAELLSQTPHNIYKSISGAKDRYSYSSSFRFDCDLVCNQLDITCDLGCK